MTAPPVANESAGVDLRSFNTLALPGRAARYRLIRDPAQLADPALARAPRFVLGGGSNLVLTGDIDRLVLHIAIRGRRLLAEDTDAWYVEAGAGENWHDFVQWTLDQGWPGLENLSLIPGTVGAAPIQNIGAYGLEVGDRIARVTVWDFEKRAFLALDHAACALAYRDSLFKRQGWHRDGRIAITAVVFRLPKAWQPLATYADVATALAGRGIAAPEARDIADAVIAVRRQKLPDPARLPNAGSFFHNPVVSADLARRLRTDHPTLPGYPQPDGRVKLAAGWLIEHAGWKGRSLGPVGMYDRQALVLVNHGGATGDDVQRTMAAVQDAVHARFGVDLAPEPVFIPGSPPVRLEN